MTRVDFLARLRRPMRISLAAAALFLVQAAGAQSAADSALAKLDAKSRFALDVLLDSADAAGIPRRPLLSKALQGIALKADDKRIITEVRRLFGELKTARAALGGVDEEELAAAAAVIHAGVKPAQLAPFRARQRGRSDLKAFAVWTDFLYRGVPNDEAFSAITKLWQDGADDATFHSLWNNVQASILQGLTPGTALQNWIRETPVRAPSSGGKPPEGTQENQSSK